MKKKTLCLNFLCLSLLGMFLLGSCRDINEVPTDNVKSTNDGLLTRSLYQYRDSFAWQDSAAVDMVNGEGKTIHETLPWEIGADNSGIPVEWIDQQIQEDYSKRIYTKANNWELVCSNVYQQSANKYILLYNKMSGVLRCFYCVLSSPAGNVTSNSIWGLGVDNSTAIFNFSSDIAKDASYRVDNPTFCSTPSGYFENDSIFSSNVGFQDGVWYGCQIECAYDPQTNSSNYQNLWLLSKGVNNITYSGTAETGGNISGTITNTSSSGNNISLSLSNVLNKDNSVALNKVSVVNNLSKTIDDGIKKNDPFFTKIWDNVTANASKWVTSGLESGVKNGISAIVSSGGTAIAGSISNLVTSLLGENKNVSTVDLKVKLNSTFKFQGSQLLPTWGEKQTPLSGTVSNNSGGALYNNVLGVWNLSRSPQIKLDIIQYQARINGMKTFEGSRTQGTYSCNENSSILIINPIISKNYYVQNFTCKVVRKRAACDKSMINSAEPALIGNQEYYIGYSLKEVTDDIDYTYGTENSGSYNGIVEVKFSLVNKTNSSDIYYYKKYFWADILKNSQVIQYIDTKTKGSGSID